MPTRSLLIHSLLLFAVSQCSRLIACDYTVRDIGFVKLDGPDFSLYVLGPETSVYSEEDAQRLGNWNIRLVASSTEETASYPDAIRKSSHFQMNGWSMWLVDSTLRALHLESASRWEQLPSIEQTLARHLDSKRMREIGEEALSSFAQVVLFDCVAASKQEIAKETATSVARLEPLLPRPILLPVRTVLISEDEREAERVLLWALGIDDANSREAVLTVVYGRGCLAGPALRGESIRLEETIGQLALVGESCECETDRSWYDERRLPVFWDNDRERQAAETLGFNPLNSRIRLEIRQILSRGGRSTASFPHGDQIDRLVDGYFESDVVGQEPRLMPIPSGRRGAEVSSQVIAGDGWEFDSMDSGNAGQEIETDVPAESNGNDNVPFPAGIKKNSTWIPLLAAGLILFAAAVVGRTLLRKQI